MVTRFRSSMAGLAETQAEVIPDDDALLNRIHKTQFNFTTGQPMSCAFDKENQSVNWAKYSTPEETGKRHRRPEDIAAVASLIAGECRKHEQSVEHCPMTDVFGFNRAHSEIRG